MWLARNLDAELSYNKQSWQISNNVVWVGLVATKQLPLKCKGMQKK